MSTKSTHRKRNAELAQIHLYAKELGFDPQDKDETGPYRSMLWACARVHSAADLDEPGRKTVIAHLRRCGAGKKKPGRATPSGERGPLVGKIRAQLTAFARTDAYADSMAKHMFGIARYEWCSPKQLSKIVAALDIDAQRHGVTERGNKK